MVLRFMGEVFSIVLGVMLALGANEWRKHANQQDLKQRMLRMIGEDAMQNREILARRIELHDALRADVSASSKLLSQGVTAYPDSLKQLNYGIIPLNTSAYETAQSAQVIPPTRPGVGFCAGSPARGHPNQPCT